MGREWMLVTGSSSLSTGGRAAVFRNGARGAVPEARVTRVTLTNAESVPRLVPGASAGRPGRRAPDGRPGRRRGTILDILVITGSKPARGGSTDEHGNRE